MSEPQPVSNLNPFMENVRVWIDKNKDLAEAKVEALAFVKGAPIKREKDRQKMQETIQEAKTLLDLVSYLYNALLMFEGLGVR